MSSGGVMVVTTRGAAVMLLAAGLVAVAGCGPGEAAEGRTAEGPAAGARGPGGRGSDGPPAVETAAVLRGSIARQVTVAGVVEPIRTVAVLSQSSGALLSVHGQEGDYVQAGAVLARLDAREIEAQLTAAEASYRVARAAFERAEQLRQRQVITLPEYERDQSAFAAAEAQLDQIRTRLGYATVRAPAAGVITEKSVEAGDVVGGQTALFRIADVSTLVVRVGVSELDVVELAPGQGVTVQLDAFPGREFGARVRRIFPSADPATRLVPVEVALQEGVGGTVRPGFLARVTFALDPRANVLLIPASAIVAGNGSPSVFVVENGRATRRSVGTGLESEGSVEVVHGLEAGEAVVALGHNTLRDGVEVRVVRGPAAVDAGASDSAAGGA